MRLGGLDMALIKYNIGQLIEPIIETNSNNLFSEKDVRGMTITKQIIPTKADVSTALQIAVTSISFVGYVVKL